MLRDLIKRFRSITGFWMKIVKIVKSRVEFYERLRALEEIDKILDSLPKTETEIAAKLIREDRNSN